MTRRHVTVVLALSALLGLGLGTASARPKPKPKKVARAVSQPIIRKQLPLPPPPPPRPPDYSYRPIKVSVPDNAAGRADLLAKVSDAITKLDPSPPVRKAHYAWLGQTPHVVVGYHAQILTASPTANGWRATIRISPRLVSTQGANVMAVDMVDEDYEMAGGTLNFLGTRQVPRTGAGNLVID
jgi:hypothetical protein